MFRRHGPTSKVLYVEQSFTAQLPNPPTLLSFCAKIPSKFAYHAGTSVLTVHGRIEENEYRELLTIYREQREIHTELRRLRDESQLYLSNTALSDLDTYAKRIRGEVLFARAWLLCEGQSEYLLLRYFASLMGTPLDQAGVTVIDYQNNGSPGAFVGLARAFEIPWLMICDNDQGGKDSIRQVQNRGLTAPEINQLVRPLPEAGMDWEMFLVKNGFSQECRQILAERSVILTMNEGTAGFEDEIAEKIRADKTGYAIALIEKLQETSPDASKVPQFLQTVIEDVITKAS
jgi:putative ATP-dependent endonuclease of OLD family